MLKKYTNCYDFETVPPPMKCIKTFGEKVIRSPTLVVYFIQQCLR